MANEDKKLDHIHEHHEHHSEDCECGCHDHEHHHDHEQHPEDCECGCHDHEHHHDNEHHPEDCECGCHDHEHDHHEHEYTKNGVTVSNHESFLIGSVSETIAADSFEKAEELLSAGMRAMAERVNEAGGIIGHIKFILTELGRSVQISVTDTEETARHYDADSYQLEGVAIVYGLSKEGLADIVSESLKTYFKKDN